LGPSCRIWGHSRPLIPGGTGRGSAGCRRRSAGPNRCMGWEVTGPIGGPTAASNQSKSQSHGEAGERPESMRLSVRSDDRPVRWRKVNPLPLFDGFVRKRNWERWAIPLTPVSGSGPRLARGDWHENRFSDSCNILNQFLWICDGLSGEQGADIARAGRPPCTRQGFLGSCGGTASAIGDWSERSIHDGAAARPKCKNGGFQAIRMAG